MQIIIGKKQTYQRQVKISPNTPAYSALANLCDRATASANVPILGTLQKYAYFYQTMLDRPIFESYMKRPCNFQLKTLNIIYVMIETVYNII